MSDVPVLVPEGKSLTDLTMGELDTASRHLQADVLECVAGGPQRYGAFIELAAIWAKRSGDTTRGTALVERFRGYTTDELFHALRMDEKPAAVDGVDPTQSTSSDESSASS